MCVVGGPAEGGFVYPDKRTLRGSTAAFVALQAACLADEGRYVCVWMKAMLLFTQMFWGWGVVNWVPTTF